MTTPRQLDTVAHAAQTPDDEQPWADLGLKPDEYAQLHEILGRRPTSSELAMYSVMWSEHCSYKSSKVHLRQFGDNVTDEMRKNLMVGIGENAGVVDIGDGYAVTFKVESHNHPSYVEPYQGAATGIGGIVRDILSMGARPVAVMDPLRFGPLDAEDTRRVLPGIIAGVGGYGNCLGLPNIGGEAVFDATYVGNPLVNALCVGVMRHEQIHLAKASGAGNQVILYGAKTGGDGIGGVSVLASETFTDEGPTKRPSVQVGDPFMEKLLIECTLELFEAELVVGIQDLGGAGLSCATSELASAGDGGMHVWLDRVPLRDSSLAPEEILMSESQERMMAVVEPRNVEAFLKICEKWDVDATVVGEVTETGRLVIEWHGEIDRRRTAAHGRARGPGLRAAVRAAGVAGRAAGRHRRRPGPARRPATSCARRCCSWSRRPTSATSRGSPTSTTATCRATPCWPSPRTPAWCGSTSETNLGVAIATDCNGRFAKLDPFAGAQLALAESYRNVATTGARPIAVTDCLNFGSPEDPDVMWQFAEATRGLAEGCRALGIPVTGGNVSFYNQTGDVAILPTPVVGVLGVIDDVTRRTPVGFAGEGQQIYLLGTTRDELDGSEWAHVVHGHLGGLPPQARPRPSRPSSPTLLINASRDGLIDAAHDLSDGGLAQALVESCLRHDVGARVWLPEELDPFVALFSESTARAIVAVPRSEEVRFTDMCSARGFAHQRIGVTDGRGADATLDVQDQFTVPLAELRAAWSATLPAAMSR